MGLESERPVPRYVTSPVVVSNGDMIAEREWPDGRRERGRVMLSGFGHFRRVQDELDRLPAFGYNVIQVEIGPRHVLKTEEEVDTGRIDHFLRMARRAASNDVQICLLLSPHYFPEWALKKYPDLRSCTDRGFLKYCVHNRRAQEVVERFLRVIIPKVRGNPAIHSIVLSNEPEQGAFGPKCALRPEWPKHLARKFGSVERMNATWKTAYGTFESVPVPRYCQPTPRNRETLEFIRFSRLEFAEFHRRMADVVREMASEIPLHVKQKGCDQYRNGQTFWSVDPELFGELSDYNGCDLVDWPDTSDGWAHADWWCLESACDYMRSCCDKPIFNSESHVLFDRGRLHVPGRHVYSALWQSAVHGQTATTAWLWERTDNPRHEFYGLFLDRPECLNAWAHGSLDLSRLADELAPIRNQPPTVLLHFSLASQVLSGRRGRNFLTTYRAASFLGQPLGVVTERMLVEYGKGGAARRPLDFAHVVLLPDDDFIEPDVRAGLDRLAARGVRIVSCSGTDRDQFERFSGERSSWRLPDCPHVCAIDGKAGVFGVESRGYVQGEKRRLSLVNHLRGPVSVRLEGEGRDLISGASVPRCVTLESQKPLFIEMPKRNE